MMMRTVILGVAVLLGGCFYGDKYNPPAGHDAGSTQDSGIDGNDAAVPMDMGSGNVDAAMTPCSAGCTGAKPICDTATNLCVGCLGNSDCAAPTPFCDSTTNMCRGCIDNSECPASGVCYQAQCLDSTKALYVNGSAASCMADGGAPTGSMTAPYCTVQAGFDAANAASTPYLVIEAGTYKPTTGHVLNISQFPTGAINMTVIGVGTPVLTVNALQGDVVWINNTGLPLTLTFDGLSFFHGMDDNDQGAGNGSGIDIVGNAGMQNNKITVLDSSFNMSDTDGFISDGATMVFDNCQFDHNIDAFDLTNTKVTITNSVISNNSFIGFTDATSNVIMDRVELFGNHSALSVEGGITITNSVFHDNPIGGTNQPVLSITHAALDQVLFNVTLANNTTAGANIKCDNASPIVANTVVFDNLTPADGIVSGCTFLNSSYTSATGPTNNDLSGCEGMVFADPSNENYQPKTGTAAPCTLIGRGINSVTLVSGDTITTDHDFAGKPRTAGKFDIGAYQSQ